MTPKTFCLITGILFLIGGLIHLARALLGVHITIGTTVIPNWVSMLVAIGCGYLAYEGFKVAKTLRMQ